jgi:molybdate transport system permease protein
MDSLLSNFGVTTSEFLTPVLLSLQVASIALIFSFVLGTLMARFMTKVEFKGKVILETIMMLPIVLPPTVVGFILIVIFGNNNFVGDFIEWLFGGSIIFTWYAAVLASTVVAFPLMYQSAKTGFLSIDKDIEEAAKVDGASDFRIFMKITMPLAAVSLITGAILSFARALGEFGATLMIAGNIPGRTQTLPTAIYVALQSGNMNLAWLWVITIIGISFIMLLFVRTKAKE